MQRLISLLLMRQWFVELQPEMQTACGRPNIVENETPQKGTKHSKHVIVTQRRTSSTWHSEQVTFLPLLWYIIFRSRLYRS